EQLRSLTSLWRLKVYKNELTEIPSWISGLQQLEVLVINANPIRTLPDSLGDLPVLRELHLGSGYGGMPLRQLPPCLRRLTRLTLLSANDCELESLPDWVSDIPLLSELYLSRNRLADLPPALAQLSQLRVLNLSDNPLNAELAAASAEGLDAVKRYLRAREGS